MVAVRFNDRKDVMLLSSKYTAEPVDTGKQVRLTRRQRERGEQATGNVVKPKLVHEYNQNMNGVDHLDQMLSYYAFNRKTVKWWKRAATHLLHMAKIQALILYNKYEQKSMTQVEFTLRLILQLANYPTSNQDAGTLMARIRTRRHLQLLPTSKMIQPWRRHNQPKGGKLSHPWTLNA